MTTIGETSLTSNSFKAMIDSKNPKIKTLKIKLKMPHHEHVLSQEMDKLTQEKESIEKKF